MALFNHMDKPIARWLRRARVFLVAAGISALAACGSGGGPMGAAPGGSAPAACTGCGGTMISLTDAPGDFLSYIVNVVSLQLTRADGTVVQALPVTTKVDFAQLVNLSEIVSTAQIPAGQYTSASITLDYAGATIVVDNGTTGVTIAANQIIDGTTSQPLASPNPTQMTLKLSLPANSPFVVTPGTVAHLALDFNLAASNAISPSTTAPTTVTVTPTLTGSLVPDTTKQERMRGGLVSVDTGASTYTIDVHPFDDDSGNSGQATVTTSATTSYTINGTGYTGAAGLAQLATLAAGTMTVAYGTLDRSTMTFTASSVLAGSSVFGSGHDGVVGTVLSRSGNTLTVANGEEEHSDLAGSTAFVHQITVTVGMNTAVSELGQSGAFTTQDISVGQLAQFSGTLGQDASGNPTLDATAGSALLMPSRVSGTVASVSGTVVTLALQSINGSAPSAFNFAGTGSGASSDAVASAYTVQLPAAISPSSLTSGAPVRFYGFVTPFGAAPPDFVALSSVDFANADVQVLIRWSSPGQTAPFSTLTSSGASISPTVLSAAAEFEMRYGFTPITAASLSGGLNFAPDAAAANPKFLIVHRVTEQADSFTTFDAFVTALTSDLNGSTTLVGLAANGPYDGSSATVSADQMIALLND
ncbi:MAG: DUF4382 domain-containing protein [Gammaproteobacteria bacterium]|nr:DUF4382 domain-containing protein [Gammaproteobacteria bacterium]